MKLYGHGYKMQQVERYEMSMGDLLLTISRKLIKAEKTDIEIRIVDLFTGEVEKWAGVNGMLTHSWSADWKVALYKISLMHDNKENFDYLKVIISDDIEMAEEEEI